MTAPVSAAEAANRARSACLLATVLRFATHTSTTAGDLDDTGWERASMVAGVRVPSAQTRRLAVDMLHDHERLISRGVAERRAVLAAVPDIGGAS